MATCSRSKTRTPSTRRPATPEVAAFVGRCNFFQGKVEGSTGGRHTIRSTATARSSKSTANLTTAAGETVTVALRPEKLEVVPAGQEVAGMNRLNTSVLTSSYVGSRYEYDVRLGNQVVQVESQRPGLAGEVQLVFEPKSALLYAADGRAQRGGTRPAHRHRLT